MRGFHGRTFQRMNRLIGVVLGSAVVVVLCSCQRTDVERPSPPRLLQANWQESQFEVVSARSEFPGRKVPGHCYGPLLEFDDELICNGYYPGMQRWSLTHFSTRERVPEVLFELGDGARLWDTPDGVYASFDGGVGRMPRRLADWRPEYSVPGTLGFRAGFTKLADRAYYVSDDALCTFDTTTPDERACVSFDAGTVNDLLPLPDGVVLATLVYHPWTLHLNYYDARDGGLTAAQSWEIPRRGVVRADLFGLWTTEMFDEKGLQRHTFDGGVLHTVQVPVPHGSWVFRDSGDFVMVEVNSNVRLWRCPTSLDEQGNFLSFDHIYSTSPAGDGTSSAGCTAHSFVLFSGGSGPFSPPTTTLIPIER